jgi:hypothetical protein
VLSVEQAATGWDTSVCLSATQKQLDPAPWECAVTPLSQPTNQIQAITQPPYSPDLTPWNFWLFLRLKTGLKGHCSVPVEEIQQYMTAYPKAVPEDFQWCFQKSQDHWRKCVCVEGQYFKGDRFSFFIYPFY